MVSMLIPYYYSFPSNGILEITALTMMMLCGWFVVQLPTQLWALLLMLLGFVPLILAANSTGSHFIWQSSIIISLIGAAFFFKGEKLVPWCSSCTDHYSINPRWECLFWYIAPAKPSKAHQQIPFRISVS
jgi:membrane-bound ClpP family serine protease